MKKIIALALVLSCIFVLASCGGSNEVDDVAAMYLNSKPTGVVVNTTQSFADHELKGEYRLLTGFYNGKEAAVYTETYQKMLSVEEGATDKIVESIETFTNKYEYLEGSGVRTNGGVWDIEAESFAPDKGAIALNLASKYVAQYTYDNHKLACVVLAKNTAAVLGLDENLEADVIIEVVDDGACVNSVIITYTIPEDEKSGVAETLVIISATYTYDLEQVVIG